VDERGTRTCSFLCSCWVTPSPSLRVTCIRGRPTTRQDAQAAVRRLTGSDLCLYPSICMFRTARNQVGAVRAIRRHTCRLLVLFHTTVLHEHVAISQLQQPLFTHGPASARKESYICMESKCIVSPGLSLRLTRFTVPLIDRIENMSCMQRRAAVSLSLSHVGMCTRNRAAGLHMRGAATGSEIRALLSLPDCDAPRAILHARPCGPN
jgi:hypothetical protein